jgi:hypothetical protein
VFSVDTCKNQVKSMEMGASNIEAQVSPTMVAVIYYVVMIHEIWTRGDLPLVMSSKNARIYRVSSNI